MTNEKENIVGYIAGVMKAGFHIRGYSFLGTGKVYDPENAIVITNKRVLFITVPMPGGDKMIANIDVPLLQSLIARKDIENKLKEMLSSMPLKQILESHPKNYFINILDIKK
jgi:hypothetical protein